MWTFYELKTKAKGVLRQNYWSCFFAVILYTLISNIISNLAFFSIKTPTENEMAEQLEVLSQMNSGHLLKLFSDNLDVIISVFLVMFLISAVVSIFIITPFSIGQNRFFTEAARGRMKLEEIFYSFINGWSKYVNILKICFLKQLFLFLWGLLGIALMAVLSFITMFSGLAVNPVLIMNLMPIWSIAMGVIAYAPVIIKTFEYFMIEYILADEPEITWREAAKKSKLMMSGEKIKTFLFLLSFIGWFFIGAMVFVIGVFFVMPYLQASFAQLYLKLKTKIQREGSQNDCQET